MGVIMVAREYPPTSVDLHSPMTSEYRHVLLRLLASHARAELAAGHAYAQGILQAPGPEEKLYAAQFAQEEVEHWHKHLKLMEELGVPLEGVKKHQGRNLFYPMLWLLMSRMSWLDVLMGAFFIDCGAAFFIEEYAQSSYAPWYRLARDILADEEGHANFGQEFLHRRIQEVGRATVQRAMNKWWRIALNFFGPPRTQYTDAYLRFGFRTRTNEERRQAFRHSIEPQIKALGLNVPNLYRQNYPFL